MNSTPIALLLGIVAVFIIVYGAFVARRRARSQKPRMVPELEMLLALAAYKSAAHSGVRVLLSRCRNLPAEQIQPRDIREAFYRVTLRKVPRVDLDVAVTAKRAADWIRYCGPHEDPEQRAVLEALDLLVIAAQVAAESPPAPEHEPKAEPATEATPTGGV